MMNHIVNVVLSSHSMYIPLAILLFITAILLVHGLKLYFAGPRNMACPSLKGQHAIVTGGNGGIGLETVIGLARLGATVTIAGRDSKKSHDALLKARAMANSDRIFLAYVDFTDLNQVNAFADSYIASGKPLHLLINNAGVMMMSDRGITKQGFERHWGINHLSHFLLTDRFLPLLHASGASRVINVASLLHTIRRFKYRDLHHATRNFDPTGAYAQSKAANIAFTAELARRTQGTGITTYSVHPGIVDTGLWGNIVYRPVSCLLWCAIRPFRYLFFKSPLDGAQTILHCALSPRDSLESGEYYADCAKGTLSCPRLLRPQVGFRLWEESAKMIALWRP